ncbi:hypothetical protein LCGC14_1571880 [marine sediment metagenome]|uniref:Uncharacterized protein n=1 Tax=marine sediment metagenome TaxID=412755 RepID=A0A0F9LJV9_9ZZZZ
MTNGAVEDTLREIAEQLATAKQTLPDAEALVEVLEEAGEDAAEVRALITETKVRIVGWEKTLQRRGVTVPSPKPEEEE